MTMDARVYRERLTAKNPAKTPVQMLWTYLQSQTNDNDPPA
jgi:hypothetical protein